MELNNIIAFGLRSWVSVACWFSSRVLLVSSYVKNCNYLNFYIGRFNNYLKLLDPMESVSMFIFGCSLAY